LFQIKKKDFFFFLTFFFTTFLLFSTKFKVFAETENLTSDDFCQKFNESMSNAEQLLKNKPQLSKKE